MAVRNQSGLVFALVLSLAAAVGGRALTQELRSRAANPTSPPREANLPVSDIPSPASEVTPAPAPTIDQLLDRLEKVRTQKEELERQEKALIEQVRAAVAKQKGRLIKMGVEVTPSPPPTVYAPLPGPTIPSTPN